ncbi:hypothetical protein D6C00_10390 [Thiohalobacter thiocyanaticus]|uniref:Uncharacterized protein n=1 Tax=Thiohalobacter thiocyanaticus TaxID=585455 RepID=A0A426QKU9_9GAMM|nr:hypothetical protein D6C00_10390 [Thiohalobacter thiocyanaticus]
MSAGWRCCACWPFCRWRCGAGAGWAERNPETGGADPNGTYFSPSSPRRRGSSVHLLCQALDSRLRGNDG